METVTINESQDLILEQNKVYKLVGVVALINKSNNIILCQDKEFDENDPYCGCPVKPLTGEYIVTTAGTIYVKLAPNAYINGRIWVTNNATGVEV